MYKSVDIVGGGGSVGGDVMKRHCGWRLLGSDPPPPLITHVIPLSAPGCLVLIPFGSPCVTMDLVFANNPLSIHGVVLLQAIGS